MTHNVNRKYAEKIQSDEGYEFSKTKPKNRTEQLIKLK